MNVFGCINPETTALRMLGTPPRKRNFTDKFGFFLCKTTRIETATDEIWEKIQTAAQKNISVARHKKTLQSKQPKQKKPPDLISILWETFWTPPLLKASPMPQTATKSTRSVLEIFQ